MDKNPPRDAEDWTGKPWIPTQENQELILILALLLGQELPLHLRNGKIHKGVPLSAIIFGGRRAKTAPLSLSISRLGSWCLCRSIMAQRLPQLQTGLLA